ncbi:MAG: glycosyltransferase family 4 protein, partial [Acidobacteria bacterium]|nr:glycosyltransferase family 4 protein [Acidobacteriota bacterium]
PLRAAAAAGEPALETRPIREGGEASPGLLRDVAAAVRAAQPDILWASESRGHGAAVWSRAAKRAPLVVHRRVMFPPKSHALSRYKYAAAAGFAAISQAVASSLVAAGVPASRIRVVPDGLPPEAFVSLPEPPAPPLRLVHVGAFDGRKGQHIVVDVLAALVARGWDLVATFLGSGPERAAVEARARSLGVGKRCEFRGEIPSVFEVLSRSHLLLLPSESEGGSLAALEAMAAGCPVLAHDTGGVAEILRGTEGGRLVSGLDPLVWTEATARLLGAPELRAQLQMRGRALARQRTVAHTAETLEAFFTDILNGG